MVDFQERDTTRGFRFGDDDEEPPPEDEPAADDGDDGDDAGKGDADEAGPDEPTPDIDEVRERLEETPGSAEAGPAGPTRNGGSPADDGTGRDAADPLAVEHAGDGGDGAEEHHDHGADGGAGDHGPPDDDGSHGHDAGHGKGGHHGDGDDHDHHHAHDLEELGVAVVTVSSSRTLADDPSGDAIVDAMVEAGHDVVTRELIGDDHDDVQRSVDALVRRGDVDVVVTTGGTGVTPDDTTVEAVRPLLDKELPGFGELFRRLSYEDIGTKVVGTRATAGVADGAPVFCLPGSTDAVDLAVEEIITEEAPHLAGLASRDDGHDGE